MYLPTLTRTGPSEERPQHEGERGQSPGLDLGNIFDLEYHKVVTDETSKMPNRYYSYTVPGVSKILWVSRRARSDQTERETRPGEDHFLPQSTNATRAHSKASLVLSGSNRDRNETRLACQPVARFNQSPRLKKVLFAQSEPNGLTVAGDGIRRAGENPSRSQS